jgi:hypothetical protein
MEHDDQTLIERGTPHWTFKFAGMWIDAALEHKRGRNWNWSITVMGGGGYPNRSAAMDRMREVVERLRRSSDE